MDCKDGFCWQNIIDLCIYVGRNCITNWQELISGLITNQVSIIEHIAPLIDEVSEFPTCSRVYLDTSACTYVGSSNNNTVPIGIHMFGGRVAADGQVVCVTAVGSVPTCGALLDDDLQETDSRGSFIMLEDGTASGCARAMRLSSSHTVDYHSEFTAIGQVVPPNTVSLLTVGSFTAQNSGVHSVTASVTTEGNDPAGNPNRHINYLTIRTASGRESEASVVIDPYFNMLSTSVDVCLESGDIVFGTITQAASAATLIPTTVIDGSFTATYLGDSDDC